MLKPQDVFAYYSQFKSWWTAVRPSSGDEWWYPANDAFLTHLWKSDSPCVPGSYGISITV